MHYAALDVFRLIHTVEKLEEIEKTQNKESTQDSVNLQKAMEFAH
jgi:hypothetical protein